MPLPPLVSHSLVQKRNHEHDKCEAQLDKLLAVYPRNAYLLTMQGCNAAGADKYDDATAFFRQARTADGLTVDHMDVYGLLLARAGDDSELGRVANDVLGGACDRPEGWMLLSMYCNVKVWVTRGVSHARSSTCLHPFAPHTTAFSPLRHRLATSLSPRRATPTKRCNTRTRPSPWTAGTPPPTASKASCC